MTSMRGVWSRLGSAIAVVATICAFAPNAVAHGGPPKFVTVSAVAPKSAPAGSPFTLTVAITIAKPYHIQANPPKQDYIPTVVIVGPMKGFTVGKVVYPKAVMAKAGGETLPVYEGAIQIKVTVTPDKSVKPGATKLPVIVKYQGCNEQTCYPPTQVATQASVNVTAAHRAPAKHASLDGALILAQASSAAPPTTMGLAVPGYRISKIEKFLGPKPFIEWLKTGSEDNGQADVVSGLLTRGGAANLAGALGLILLLGLALNLTPCVYPLIPITIGYFGRQAANGAKTGGLAICYALGMASMYTALGLLAGLFGKGFGAQLNNPFVLIFFSALMFALGLSNFDRKDGRPYWQLQLPSGLTSHAHSRAGYVGAGTMGVMVGMVAAPCVGPIVVALIQVVATTHNVGLGALVFFTLGMGLALPYLALGFGLVKALPRAGEWMVAVKHLFGILLFGMSIYYLRGLLNPVVYRTIFLLFCAWASVFLIFRDHTGNQAKKFSMFKRAVGVATAALGVFTFIPAAESAPALKFETPTDFAAMQRRLEQARVENKEVLIDFGAKWCAECKELDEKTFSNNEVATATGNMVALRFRLDDFDGDAAQPYRKLFDIVGLPMVVHLVPDNGPTRTANVD